MDKQGIRDIVENSVNDSVMSPIHIDLSLVQFSPTLEQFIYVNNSIWSPIVDSVYEAIQIRVVPIVKSRL